MILQPKTQDIGYFVFFFCLTKPTKNLKNLWKFIAIFNLKCMFMKTPIYQGSISKNSWSSTAANGQWFIIWIVVVQDLHNNVMQSFLKNTIVKLFNASWSGAPCFSSWYYKLLLRSYMYYNFTYLEPVAISCEKCT